MSDSSGGPRYITITLPNGRVIEVLENATQRSVARDAIAAGYITEEEMYRDNKPLADAMGYKGPRQQAPQVQDIQDPTSAAEPFGGPFGSAPSPEGGQVPLSGFEEEQPSRPSSTGLAGPAAGSQGRLSLSPDATQFQRGPSAVAGTPPEQPRPQQQPQQQQQPREPQEKDYFTGPVGIVLKSLDIPGTPFGHLGLGDFIDDTARAIASGFSSGQFGSNSFDVMIEGAAADNQTIQQMIDASKKVADYGPSDEMNNFTKIYEKEGSGFFGLMKGLAYNPGVVPEVIVSSFSGLFNKKSAQAGVAVLSAGAGYGAATGAAFGGVGAAPGALAGAVSSIPYAIAAGSTVLETGATFAELLQEELKGKEFNVENVKSILQDPEKLSNLRVRAAGRGLTIGAFDALTGKLAGSIGSKVISKGGSKAASVAAGSAIEAVGGSGGEAAGRLVAGQEMDIAEIGLEGIAEIPMGAIDVGAAAFGNPKYTINGERRTEKDLQDIINGATPEELSRMKIDIDNDKRGYGKKIKDIIQTGEIEKQVRLANAGIDDVSLRQLVELEKELFSLSENKTQSAKDRVSEIKSQISEIRGNAIYAPMPKYSIDGISMPAEDFRKAVASMSPKEFIAAKIDIQNGEKSITDFLENKASVSLRATGSTEAASAVAEEEFTIDDAKELVGKVVEYRGQEGYVDIDEGNKVTFTTVGGGKIYEIGTEEDMQALANVAEVPIDNVVNDDGSITIGNKTFVADIGAADITRDNEGGIYSVEIETDDGVKTFYGDLAATIIYENQLRTVRQDENLLAQIETNITTDAEIKSLIEQERDKQKRRLARRKAGKGAKGPVAQRETKGARIGDEKEQAAEVEGDPKDWTKEEMDEFNALMEQEELDTIEQRMADFVVNNKQHFNTTKGGAKTIRMKAPKAIKKAWADMQDTLEYKKLREAEQEQKPTADAVQERTTAEVGAQPVGTEVTRQEGRGGVGPSVQGPEAPQAGGPEGEVIQERADSKGRVTKVSPVKTKSKDGSIDITTFSVNREGREITGSGLSFNSIDEFVEANPGLDQDSIDFLTDNSDSGIREIILRKHRHNPKTGVAGLTVAIITNNGTIDAELKSSGAFSSTAIAPTTPTAEGPVRPEAPPAVQKEPSITSTDTPPKSTISVVSEGSSAIGFTTSKGSTYEVNEEGQTIRTKKSEGRGKGETYQPHNVLFVTTEESNDLLEELRGGAIYRFVVEDANSQTGARVIGEGESIKGKKIALGLFAKDGRLIKYIPSKTQPKVGLHPVELRYETRNGERVGMRHVGNAIVSINEASTASTAAPAPTIAPTPNKETVAKMKELDKIEEKMSSMAKKLNAPAKKAFDKMVAADPRIDQVKRANFDKAVTDLEKSGKLKVRCP